MKSQLFKRVKLPCSQTFVPVLALFVTLAGLIGQARSPVPPDEPKPLLTGGPTAATARNDYPGFVGLKFTVGATPIRVLSLGRLYLAGNAQTHIVKLVDANNGNDVSNGAVSLTMTPGTVNTFEYAPLTAPVTLPANSSYYLVTQEFAGGDTWYDYAPVTGDPAVVVNKPAYQQSNGAYSILNVSSSSYTPPNLLFTFTTTTTTAPPNVVITAPVPGTVSGSVQLTATAQADSGLTITGVRFRFNGSDVGLLLTSSPYTFSLDTTSLTNGEGDLTAVATDSASSTATSSPIHLTISNPVTTSTGVAFIRSGPAPGAALRNDYSGFVGTQFVVGSTPLQVTQLGRWVVAGNTGAHTVKLVRGDGADVPGGTVSLNLAGKPADQYAYAALDAPVTLAANASYFLVTQETSGGDRWFDYSTVTTDPAGTLSGPAFQQSNGAYTTLGVASSSFGPPNFLFSTGAPSSPPPSVAVAGVLPGTVSGILQLTATATPYSGLTISGVQYKFNGAVVSPVLTTSPYNFSLDTTTIANGSGNLTAVATDSALNTGTSDPIALTISNTVSTPTGTVFIRTAPAAGATSRNDYSGFVGTQFTVGGTPLQVTQLGRWMITGNSGTHIVKFVQNNGMDVPGGSVSVSLAGNAPGQYVYAQLSAPVTLAANGVYYLVTQEVAGGDRWYDYSTVTTDPAGSLNAPAFEQGNGAYTTLGVASAAYGPPNFLFSVATAGTPPPTVSITAPLAGTVSGSIMLSADASAYAGLHITGVQFKFNGNNIGPVLTAAPYTFNFDTTTVPNGSGNLTAVATDSSGNSTTSDPVVLIINSPVSTPAGTAFIRSAPGAGAALRNDYAGFVGAQFTVGGTALQVSRLGRWMVPGNTGTHLVKLVDFNGNDVPGGSVSVNLASQTPGQYIYAQLASPVTLSANAIYFLATQEAAGGDQWYNYSTVTADPAATLNGPAFQQGNGAFTTLGVASSSFGTPNLLFSTGTVGTPPPSVSINQPLPGTVSGTVTLAADASPYAGLSITGVQFQFNGTNVGPALTVSPYSYDLDTKTLDNGNGNLTAVATDSAGNSRTSDPIALNISNSVATPNGTAFVRTGPAAGTATRNDYTGYVGMQFSVGGTPLHVTQLGRWMVAGNTGKHIVKLVQFDGNDVPGASVSLNLAGKTAGTYAYGALSSPVTLAANTTYFLVTQETAGADLWYDYSSLTSDSAGTINAPSYQQTNGAYTSLGILSSSFGPVNFLFTTGDIASPAGPTVVITSPTPGTVSGMIVLSATATPADGLTIVSTQFKLGDTPVTSPLDTTTLLNGQYTLVATATDSAGANGTSQPVTILVDNAGSSATPLVTGTPVTGLRNDFSGLIGMQFTVGATPIRVNQLGRWVSATTATSHLVKLVDAATGADLVGGTVTIPAGAGGGGFVYAPLVSVVTLQANHVYYLLTAETSGGDAWYDVGTITANGVVTVNGPAYQQSNGAYTLLHNAPESYGPVNLQFGF